MNIKKNACAWLTIWVDPPSMKNMEVGEKEVLAMRGKRKEKKLALDGVASRL